jgi:hypothetical protein
VPNFLEQLVAEWFEYRGYFVRRNVCVGKRVKGGHDGELDVVAFHPGENKLVHIEPSMDSDRWDEREKRFKRKFDTGRRHIPELFRHFGSLPEIESIALLVYASSKTRSHVGGARILMIHDLMKEIREYLHFRRIEREAVPEQFVILRSLQFASQYWD